MRRLTFLLLLLTALLPTGLLAITWTAHVGHNKPEGMDNFEIAFFNDEGLGIYPMIFQSEGLDWNFELISGVPGETTVRFYGSNPVPPGTGVVFGIRDDVIGGGIVERVSWSSGEERYPLSEVAATLFLTPAQNVRVVIKNMSAEQWIQLNAAKYKTAVTPFPMDQLNVNDQPPESFTYSGISPTDLAPGQSLEYTFPLNRSEYVILYNYGEWFEPGRDGYCQPIISYLQVHVSEMTPTRDETWSEVKQKYE